MIGQSGPVQQNRRQIHDSITIARIVADAYPDPLAICFVLAIGCASVLATGGAESKEQSVLDQARTRYERIAEFGPPALSEQTEDGVKIGVFAFRQGHTIGAKASFTVA